MKKSVLLIVGTLLISLFISVLVGEYIVRGVMPQITYKQARVVGLRIYEKSDYLPFTLKPNLQTNHLGYTREFDHTLRINNLGFRGDDMTESKAENTFRILVLGDSMTFGWGVEDNQTFPYELQEALNNQETSLKQKIEVINAGFADGYSPDSYYAFLKRQGVKLQPDLVLLTLFPYNDVPDMLEMDWEADERGYPVKVTSLDRTVKDGYQTFRQKTEWKYEIPVLRNSHLAMLLFQALERNSPKTVEVIRRVLNVQDPPNRTNEKEVTECLYHNDCVDKFNKPFEQIDFLLKGFRDLTLEQNQKFMVLLMPAPDQVKPVAEKVASRVAENPLIALKDNREVTTLLADQYPQKRFREFLTAEKIPFLDLLPFLVDSSSQHYFYGRDGHLTATGTKRVGQGIAMYLLSSSTMLPEATQ